MSDERGREGEREGSPVAGSHPSPSRSRSRSSLVLALALLLLAPCASATITIEEVNVPERTLAGQAFNVSVLLANDGPARSVYLFAALYDRADGRDPCGPATDPAFRTFTQLVQEAVDVPANTAITHPSEGGRWQHRYRTQDAAADPEVAQYCVFVANATSGPTIEYEAYHATRLAVRSQNAAPIAEFSWTPDRPAPGAAVRFEASATDAEGDPVRFLWDFGHFDAGGRAAGEGSIVVQDFYPAGSYVVTLTATDDLTPATLARTIEVVEAGEAKREGIPFPSPLWLIVVVLVAIRLRDER